MIRPDPKSIVGDRLCLQKDQKPEKSECFYDLIQENNFRPHKKVPLSVILYLSHIAHIFQNSFKG